MSHSCMLRIIYPALYSARLFLNSARKHCLGREHLFRHFTSIGKNQESNTIYALCSGPLTKTGVAVIRVSGVNAFEAVKAMTRQTSAFPEMRKATIRMILDFKSKNIIDKGLILCFDENASYTAEKVVEFHLHGSPAVVTAVLQSLSCLPSFRLADAGEFSKRALLNGKMSFLEVESLSDLLNAETELQRQQAIRGVNGELNDRCWKWRSQLMRSLAYAETLIDFSDDVDDESIHLIDTTLDLSEICQEMQLLLSNYDRGQLIKHGVQVTLCGPPNAGKSSLLNMLVGSDVAIISTIAGTTRDVLKVDMDLNGYKVILHDTAGLHQSTDELECEGMKRTRAAVATSLLQVVIVDITSNVCESIDSINSILHEVNRENMIIVLNKDDLLDIESIQKKRNEVQKRYPHAVDVLTISCKQTTSITSLTNRLSTIIQLLLLKNDTESTDLITRERQRNCLQQCILSLTRCIARAGEGYIDLQAEELRDCLGSLTRLTGDVNVEEILDIVFSDFCIGK